MFTFGCGDNLKLNFNENQYFLDQIAIADIF